MKFFLRKPESYQMLLKNIIYFSFLIGLALMIIFEPVYSQNEIIRFPDTTFIFEPSPTKEDYEKVLETWTKKTTCLFDKNVWKDVVLNDKKNNTQKKFEELPEIEKETILYLNSKRYAGFLSFLSKAWDDELKKFENQNYKPIPKSKIENPKQEPALKSDIVAYQNILFDIRKNLAYEQEKFLEEYFNKNSDIFSDKEKKEATKILRDWNEKEKLYEKRYEPIFIFDFQQEEKKWLMLQE